MCGYMIDTTKGIHEESGLMYSEIENILTGRGLSVKGGVIDFYKKDEVYNLNFVDVGKNKIIEIWLPSGKKYQGEKKNLKLETIRDKEFSTAFLISTSIEEYLKKAPELFSDSRLKAMEECKEIIRYEGPGKGEILNQNELDKYVYEWEELGMHRGEVILPEIRRANPSTTRYMKEVDLRSGGEGSLNDAITGLNDWMATVEKKTERYLKSKVDSLEEIMSRWQLEYGSI